MGQSSSADTKNVSVWIGTWNLGNEAPPKDLSWIPKNKDIVAVGVQEALYEPRAGFLDCEQDWFLSVHNHLGEDKYKLVSEQTLTPRTDKTYKTESAFKAAVREGKARPAGIRLSVYVANKLAKEVLGSETNLQTCGRLNNLSGNKGGINISLRIGDISLAFVSVHLNAHLPELERRNKDYRTISAGLHSPLLEFGEGEAEAAAAAEAGDDEDNSRDIEVVNRHDVVFFFGDLNYRLDPPVMSDELKLAEVLQCIEDQDWQQLIQFDQLKNEQKAGRILHGYNEAAITFAPTFKMSKSNMMNPDPKARYNPKRIPAYTDRILFKEAPGVSVVCDEYKSLYGEFAHQSDHIPVCASFQVPVCFTKHKAKDKKKEASVVLHNLSWAPERIDARIEPDAQICVSLVHKFSAERVMTPAAPLSKPEWNTPIKIMATANDAECRQFPLLFTIRNVDSAEASMNKLGEGMINFNKLHASGAFAISVTQAGISHGILSGRLEVLK